MSEEHNLAEGRKRPRNTGEALLLLKSLVGPKGDPPGAHPKSEFINTKTAAQWLGIPERSMQQYVQMGLLPSYKLGKHRLFRKNELLEALGATRRATRAEILR
ncbi:MAG: helix-turn-helix domain-containing protein [Chthoniobacterales bacterium]|jgi:excisionase family DNA binding protein